MSSPDDTFGLVGVRLDGKYDVEAVVAEGGFGVVYRAMHRALQKPVAVKVLKTPPTVPESARAEFINKFVFEARVIARLEHPGIVRVLDFGGGLLPSGGAAPWLVLEWIDGQTLDDDLDTRRFQAGRAPAEALAMLRPIFEALALAHDEGIAHRDIKPANVMLARTRRGVEARLLDFGIAKAMGDDEHSSSGHTATQSVLRAFTLAYAAPEQLGGTRTGPWTDVHALALLLVEMLTNSAPLSGEDSTALSADVLSPVRPTPAKFGLDVGSWEPVFARALALRPSERFQHAGEFLRALDATMPASVRWTVTRASFAPPLDSDATEITTLRPIHHAPLPPPPRSRNLWLALALFAALVAVASIAGIVSLRATPVSTRGAASTPPPTVVVAAPAATIVTPPPARPSVAPAAPSPTVVAPAPAPPPTPERLPTVAQTLVVRVDAAAPPRPTPPSAAQVPVARPPRQPPRTLPSVQPRVHEHVPVE
jgi:serine/threonine protein kinase